MIRNLTLKILREIFAYFLCAGEQYDEINGKQCSSDKKSRREVEQNLASNAKF